MSTSRRNFLRSSLQTGAAASIVTPAIIFPRRALATTNPDPTTMDLVIGQGHANYQEAFIYDPTNGFPNPGLPTETMQQNVNAWQALDAFALANGIYNQSGIYGQGNLLTSLNPDYLRFAVNQTQIGSLQTDYFTCIRLTDPTTEMNLSVSNPIGSGTDLRNAVQGIIQCFTLYASGSFISATTRGPNPSLMNARYDAGSSTPEATMVAYATGAVLSGAAILGAAGGSGILTGALVGTALTIGMAWVGVGLMALGVGAFIYTGYRIFTQKKKESPAAWDHYLINSEPIYLLRLQNRVPPLYPPLESPPGPPPEI